MNGINCIYICMHYTQVWDAVAWLVEALCYKPEVTDLIPDGHWIFQLT
jgi:hypothetical protein